MSARARAPLNIKRVSLSDILRQLKMTGWYWGDLSSQDANEILRKAQTGSFILRDSTDACHLFTLSLKVRNFVISVRVTFSRGQFKLDSCHQEDCPSFDSVVDLINYYLADETREFYITVPDLGEFPVSLRHPIVKEVPTLQHLCRMCIVRGSRTAANLRTLPLPPHLVRFLLEFAPSEPSSPGSGSSSPSSSSSSSSRPNSTSHPSDS